MPTRDTFWQQIMDLTNLFDYPNQNIDINSEVVDSQNIIAEECEEMSA